jgi:type II secretion system protein I
MAKKLIQSLSNNKGFTLIEVMIALAIFAVFIVAFITSQGINLADSTKMQEEINLKNFAEYKINQIITTPPELNDSLTLSGDKGKFEENEDYTFEVKYKRVEIDIQKIMGATSDENDSSASPAQGKITQNITKNLKELVWQVEVKITNTLSGNTFTVASWIYNHKAKVLFEGI